MLSALDWLTLEVKHLPAARSFYTDQLDLNIDCQTEREAVLSAGETELRLRTPSTVPRGGLHTHYAFTTPADEYRDWKNRLGEAFDLVEHDFGGTRSLYTYDPDGNCVEIGQADTSGTGLTGIFEIVLEVEDLERAESFYRRLGGEPTSRGGERRRVRLDLGPVDLELWEPQLGIADARGGVHVDFGTTADDPDDIVDRIGRSACATEALDDGVRIRDPDGHYLTVAPP